MTPWLLRKSFGCWISGLGECHIYMLCMCRARLSMDGGLMAGQGGELQISPAEASLGQALVVLGGFLGSWAVGRGVLGWVSWCTEEFSQLWGVSDWVWGRTWWRVGQLWPGTAALPSLSELGWHWRSFRTPPLSIAPRCWFCSPHWPHWNTMLDLTPFAEVT